MYETHDKRALLLPNVTSADAGKVLAVDENGKLSLEEIGSGLPEVDSSDAGRVLTVSADGEWEAASPSGGGMTLYGPYLVVNSEAGTIDASGTSSISLDLITDEDGNSVEDNYDAFYLLNCIPLGSSTYRFLGVCPRYVEAISETGSTVNVSAQDIQLSFYSTIELQPVSQGE